MQPSTDPLRSDSGRTPLPARDFEAFIEAWQTPLLRYALRIMRDEDAAQDVVQEVFLRYFKTPPRQGEPRQLAAWLYRVTHNACVDQIRRESRLREQERDLTPPDPTPPPSRALELEQVRGQLDRLMTRLSQNQRAVLALKIEEGKSYKEISEITGLSVSNVGFQIHYALKKLARLIREAEGTMEAIQS